MCKFCLPKTRFIESTILRKNLTTPKRKPMNLDEFIIACFCVIDDLLPIVGCASALT